MRSFGGSFRITVKKFITIHILILIFDKVKNQNNVFSAVARK